MRSSSERKEIDPLEMDYSSTPIPKEIHLIWVGNREIKYAYMSTMLQISEVAIKSNFRINLWINDEKNIIKSLQRREYIAAIEDPKIKKIGAIHIRNINELFLKMKTDPFFQQDDLCKVITSRINRELIGFHNFAAASDILRYVILVLEGGYYLDTDNTLEFKKGKIFEEETLLSGLKISMQLKAGGYTNNDFIASVPQHPLMKKLIKKVLEKLKEQDNLFLPAMDYAPFKISKDDKQNKTELSQTDLRRWPYPPNVTTHTRFISTRHRLTIHSTGPGMLSNVIRTFWEEYQEHHKGVPEKINEMKKMFVKDKNDNKLAGLLAGIMCRGAGDSTWCNALKFKKTQGIDDTEVITMKLLR
jgi:hypothetical protein